MRLSRCPTVWIDVCVAEAAGGVAVHCLIVLQVDCSHLPSLVMPLQWMWPPEIDVKVLGGTSGTGGLPGAACLPPGLQHVPQSEVVRSPLHCNWVKNKLGIKSVLVFILLVSIEFHFPAKDLFSL